MGIDIGSISTKGVIIDEYNNIITSSYLYTEGNPIKAVKKVIKNMREDIDLNNYQVVSVGTTGSARKLIGTMLGAKTIKNEIWTLNAQEVDIIFNEIFKDKFKLKYQYKFSILDCYF